MRVGHVGADDGEDDLDLVAEPVREGGAQRAVGEAAGEDGILGRAAFTTEERARDLAGGVGTLFDVDGQREEVGAGTDVLGRVGGGEDSGATQGCNDGAHALLSKLAGLERQGLVGTGEGTRHSDGVSHDELLSTAAHEATAVFGAEAGSQSRMSTLQPRADAPRNLGTHD